MEDVRSRCTLKSLVRVYELTMNLTRSISVWTSMIRRCSSSDERGSERRVLMMFVYENAVSKF